MKWALTAIDQELMHRPVAATLVAEHLAVVMLVHLLRVHLAREPRAVSGWPAGLADPLVTTALASLHRDPAHTWTVAEPARAAAVSRSTLAARFKATVGQGPLNTSHACASSSQPGSYGKAVQHSPVMDSEGEHEAAGSLQRSSPGCCHLLLLAARPGGSRSALEYGIAALRIA
ncbi:helix-turn-helix transcriptional regulator [Streptomyces camelliae]|uniref:Helix-turn-helix transcriptional regulator n=1 Tax=Streptomyces camelliae TaxID=3004093 RepID=A0ABY7PIG4_9ACTN|nr:helix-turn-helix transcriptional regulator [Streptomyces sp. HUAS 2-6]WBO69512.1 helix-turn-helix transcriptional regulator [Streptomyces sp. HUAS 2-6]